MVSNKIKDRIAGYRAEYKKKLNRISIKRFRKKYDNLSKSHQKIIENEFKKKFPKYLVQPENVDYSTKLKERIKKIPTKIIKKQKMVISKDKKKPKKTSREKMLHRRAKIASGKNIDSENQYVDRLKKELGPKALVFRTGKAEGVPDIVVYKDKKLSFYEVKPAEPKTKKNALLKPTQSTWMKQFCFKNGIDVYLAFYKGERNFKYAIRKLNLIKIRNYLQSTKNIDKILENIRRYSYR